MPDPENILAMRLGGIGEILVITPALRAIRDAWPDAHITLLGEEPAVETVRELGVVDEIISANAVYRAQGWTWAFSPRFYGALARLASKVMKRRYDLFLNFNHLYERQSVLKPLMVSLMSRAPRRVGFDSFGRGFFLTDRIPDERDQMRHLLYRNHEFLEPLGLRPTNQMEIGITREERSNAAALVDEWGIRNGRFVIGAHPGSSRPASRWSSERFTKVLQDLQAEHDGRVVVVGAPAETSLCESISREIPDSINAAGKTSLGTLAALMPQFNLFLSNDSGPMHIAQAKGVPTVGLFGPGEFPIWGTYLDPNFAAVRRSVPCSPCYLYTCSHQTCMRLIEPRDVMEAVDRVLHEHSPRA